MNKALYNQFIVLFTSRLLQTNNKSNTTQRENKGDNKKNKGNQEIYKVH
jgi:hypothetical protein